MKKFKNLILPVIFCAVVFGFFVLFVILPKKEFSQNEKRVLEEKPKFVISDVFDGELKKSFEAYITDHFPFRDSFIEINSYFMKAIGKSQIRDVYCGKEGYLFAVPKDYDKKLIKRNLDAVNEFSQSSAAPVTFICIPTGGYSLNNLLPLYHKNYDDNSVFDAVKNNENKFTFLDTENLFKNKKEYYYKTDHHLTADGSLVLYKAICEQLNLKPYDFKLYKTADGFCGTAYSSSGLFLTKPDKIKLYKNSDDKNFSVETTDGKKTDIHDGLFFLNRLNELDKYTVFLDGNHAFQKITNHSNKDGEKLLIVKDSYAHCVTTLLAENFSEIYTVDLRYYRGSVKKAAEEYGVSRIVVLYGAENFATSTDIIRIKF